MHQFNRSSPFADGGNILSEIHNGSVFQRAVSFRAQFSRDWRGSAAESAWLGGVAVIEAEGTPEPLLPMNNSVG